MADCRQLIKKLLKVAFLENGLDGHKFKLFPANI